MKNIKIYSCFSDKKMPIEKVLSELTDSNLDLGRYSTQTVIDLRNAVRDLLDWKKRVEVVANQILDEDDCLGRVNKLSLDQLEKELGE